MHPCTLSPLVLPVILAAACAPVPRAPVDGTVTQGAGSHPGIDFGGPPFPMGGRPVAAICRGVVAEARSTPPQDGRGIIVVVNHDSGYQSQYWHLSGVAVRPGQAVGTGQLVGFVGNTGYSFGAHLHFQLNHNGGLQTGALNDTFRLGQRYAQGTPWGAGLNPPLSCP